MKKTGRKYITKTFINIIIILAMSLSFTTNSYASSLGKMGDIYTPDASVIGIGQKILWLVQIICYAAAFIILLLKGVKFMKSAPEAKADVKKELVAYSIGAFILFGVGTLVRIIANIAIDNLN